MPSGVKEIILQGAWDWVNNVIQPPNPDSQILLPSREDDPVHLPAPSPPFVTLNLSALGQRSSSLETVSKETGAAEITETIRQAKTGTLSLRLVGEEAEDWGHILSITYDRFPADVASIADILAFTDTSYESEDGQFLRRHELDLLIEYYTIVDIVSNSVPAKSTRITNNAGSGEPITGDLDVSNS